MTLFSKILAASALVLSTLTSVSGIATPNVGQKIDRAFADGGRFFFTLTEADYHGCAQGRFGLGLNDPRVGLIMAAYLSGRTVSVTSSKCVFDGDAEVGIIYFER